MNPHRNSVAVAAITGRRNVEAIIGRLHFRLLPPHLSRLAPLLFLTALAFLLHTSHSSSSSPPPGVDTHGTGMSDLWQRHFNQGELFDPANPAHHPEADADGDGWSNLKESIAGTDPFCGRPPEGLAVSYVTYLKDQEEAPTPEFPDGREIDLAIVSWDTVPGKTYTLKASPDLEAESWIEVAGPFYGSGMPEAVPLLLTDGAGETAPRLFWRVRIEDVDSDGDGLTDYEEWLLGTNSWSAETHPGIPDLWIATHFPTAVGFDPDALSANGFYTHAECLELGLDPNETQLPREAARWDDHATWDRAPESRYVVIGLSTPPNYQGGVDGIVDPHLTLPDGIEGLVPALGAYQSSPPQFGVVALGPDGRVMVTEDRRALLTGVEQAPDGFRTWVGDPSAQDVWGTPLQWEANAAVMGIGLGADGAALGVGVLPLVDAGDNDHPTSGPAYANAYWQKQPPPSAGQQGSATRVYDNLAAIGPGFVIGEFKAGHDGTQFPGLHAAGMDDFGIHRAITQFPWAYIYQGTPTNMTTWTWASSDLKKPVYARSGEVFLSAHSPTYSKIHLSATDTLDGPEAFNAEAMALLQGVPDQYGILTSEALWLRQPDGSWAALRENSTSVGEHKTGESAAQGGIGGIAINSRGEILRDPTTLWRNGKDYDIDELVLSPGWSDFHITQINDSGIMAGFANQCENGLAVILLMPLEGLYVNRDAANNTWESEDAIQDLQPGQPLYSQPPMLLGDNQVNTGDLASWTVRISDSTIASTTSFSWEAEGPIGLNPQQVATFGGLAENVWKIENPLNWRPGKYIIRCTMILSGGINAHLEFIQEIGVRSGEIMVVGWIDADAVILPDGDSAPETINNVEANSIADILNHPLRRATFMTRIAFNDGFPYKMPLTPEVTRQYFNAFMIKTSGNPPPPQHFRAPITGTSMEMVDYQAIVDFLSNTRNYRLANRFQVKFLVDEQGKIKDEPFCAPQWAKAGLTPVDLKPEKWFELFADGMFDNIPAEEGEFHGLINTNGQVLNFNTAQAYSSELPSSIAQYSQARISGDGNASGGYISQQVNGRKVPWIWSEVKFEAPLAQGTVATIPNHEIFPAVWIYYNGELIEALIDPIEENDLENFIQLGPELTD